MTHIIANGEFCRETMDKLVLARRAMRCLEAFAVPIGQATLVYAPLHATAALVNRRALDQFRTVFLDGATPSAEVDALATRFATPLVDPPQPRTGLLGIPYFLGLLPTRGCNMACRYCDFVAPKASSRVMSLDVARAAIDGYFRLLGESQTQHAEVQFFGGEPFHAADVVHFAVAYARLRSAELGLSCRFEGTTNGLYSEARCRWIADNFDAVVLSLDGPPDIQDRHRPTLKGGRTSNIVMRSAAILSEGSSHLVLRACVTQGTAPRLLEIAQWFACTFRPSQVCFEALQPSPLSAAAGLTAPDPYVFAANFDAARRWLADRDIEAVLSTADIERCQVSFCPVGKDALIVAPDGQVNACYLLEESWRAVGLDMRIGKLRVADATFALDASAIERVRGLNVYNKPRCRACFCRYHCAGGCHVNHPCASPPGAYDDLCIMTRLTTAARLLRQLGQDAVADAWLADRPALERAALQPDDRLMRAGECV